MAVTRTIKVWTDSIGPAICRGAKCRKPIQWGEIVSTGRKMCFDGDAVVLRTGNDPQTWREYSEFDFADNHWSTCQDAKSFDRKRS
jgi:hypothetical protein